MKQHHHKLRKPHSGQIRSKFKTPKIIFVDVDGTLVFQNPLRINVKLVAMLKQKKEKGYELVLWSARGEQHARMIAQIGNCEDLFSHIISKPGYIIDDKNWRWTSFVTRLKVPR